MALPLAGKAIVINRSVAAPVTYSFAAGREYSSSVT